MLGHTVAETLQWAITLSFTSKSASSPSSAPREGRRGSKSGQQTPLLRNSYQPPDMVAGLDEDEREFLTSILPAGTTAAPYQSYGSCVSVSKRHPQRNVGSDVSEKGGATSYSEVDDGKGNSNCATGANNQCNSAAGALNYYLGCSAQGNTDKMKIYDSNLGEKLRIQQTPHHRRSLSGGSRSTAVPFSLAVEEIGLTAEVRANF